MWKQSDEIDLIAAAFVKCQAALEAAPKTAENPFFHSTYADLASVVSATRPILAAHNLSVVQCFEPSESPGILAITTTLLHESGQWWSSLLTMPLDKATPQGFGSAATYARRYAYSALIGVITEADGDAEAATSRNKPDDKPDQNALKANSSMPTCPNCNTNDSVIASRPEYGGGYCCWKNRDGCGCKFSADDEQGEPFELEIPKTPKGIQITVLPDLLDYVNYCAEQGWTDKIAAIDAYCHEADREGWPDAAVAVRLVELMSGGK